VVGGCGLLATSMAFAGAVVVLAAFGLVAGRKA
jgi:hypothetical protein